LAYAPLVVAILDAGMVCTASLPAPAEMEASLHIAKTGSSILDSILVCRRVESEPNRIGGDPAELHEQLLAECGAVQAGGVRLGVGDVYCLALGHVARLATVRAVDDWMRHAPVVERLARAEGLLRSIAEEVVLQRLPARIIALLSASESRQLDQRGSAGLADLARHGTGRCALCATL
jgi:putative DNA methylase